MSDGEKPVAERYDPASIEPRWQAYWDEHQTFGAKRTPGRPKYYVLDMFPYPSGDGLHVGHPEGYTATDIVARYKRMCGFDVLHPMGWDAFGLPAEKYAIKTGTHPRDTTKKNVATFKRQLKALGFSYDWSREVDTTDADYVRWTQWIFLQLFKRGLAFQSEAPVNWCAALGTVLANEEVVDGKSEDGHPVVRLPLRQWMLRITEYADRLAADLDALDWPDTKAKQLHWIGRSEGAEISFGLEGSTEVLSVFTTRCDTLPGVTFVTVAPEHPLVKKLATSDRAAEVEEYVRTALAKTDMDRTDLSREKTGVFLGSYAINPINGDRVPVWVGDYVIGTYGTGAVMGVPAHDERDHAFAKTYSLPIVAVVASETGEAINVADAAFTDDGVAHGVRAAIPIADGTKSAAVRAQIVKCLDSMGRGKVRVTYRLRDWIFSRQRYWGEPMPIYFPVDCDGDPRKPETQFTIRFKEPIAVDESELPLRLPELDNFSPGDDPAGPLARATDWRFFQKDDKWFARETNTMPQWAGSCWYYLRFIDPRNDTTAWSQEAYDAWMPVDLYVGGSEHAVLHLLYARFWHKVLHDIGAVRHGEPFTKLVHQGMILGEDGQKMSKSRGNVINPDHIVKSHGADSLRAYEMFMGPLEAVKPWQTSGIEGVKRFLDRVWNVCTGPLSETCDEATKKLLHKTIQKVTHDIETMHFNTAVSQMMVLTKHLGTLDTAPREAVRTLALLVSPFAPHLGEELWSRLGGAHSLAYESWPKFDAALVKDDTVEIGVQVNGKLRGTVTLAIDADEATAKAASLADPKVAAFVEGKALKKLVYVKGKIVNFIVG